MQLRDYQIDIDRETVEAWNTCRNICGVMPTGAGKTVWMGNVINRETAPVCAIAHRQELVGQISLALGKYGLCHNIIAPMSVVKQIMQLHHMEFNRSFIDPSSRVAVAGVDTLKSRRKDLSRWAQSVGLWVIDECHHVLRGNKWGMVVEMFPNARGLGVTATPIRADGKGLGQHADGVFDCLIEGPTMRELIDRGYLTDYRIFAPPSTLDLSTVDISKSTGDYSKNKLRTAVQKSSIMGDVVEHYLRIASGKLGITFATDVVTATDIAARFNNAGVVSEVVSAKTPTMQRVNILRRFRERSVQQLVNVDLFGEGFDLPALEVVSMARPTQSYALYSQQFGRALRIMEGKEHALIIDHVGNVTRHGLPDAPRNWSLDRRAKRSKGGASDVIPVKVCVECTAVYEAIHPVCPYCQTAPQPADRSKPEFVDGDLTELDPSVLAQMRGEIDRIDAPAESVGKRLEAAGAPPAAVGGAIKNHRERQEAQQGLRGCIRWWARNHTDIKRSYREFYFKFGIDVGTAQTLGKREALELAERIMKEL